MKNTKQFIVVPRPQKKNPSAKLLEFLDIAIKMSDVSLKKVVGEEKNPKRLIVQATPEAIEKLGSQFGEDIIIEPDSDLQML